MDVLTIVLVVLVVAAIWCVIEVALTVRRARTGVQRAVKAVDDLTADVKGTLSDVKPLLSNVDAAVSEARPVIAHVDEVVTQAKPAATDVSPLLKQATSAVENLSGSLERVDAILGDVSRLTGSTANATAAVGAATTGILEKVRGRIGRRGADAPQRQLAGGPADGELDDAPAVAPTLAEEGSAVVSEVPAGPVVSDDAGYFTYPDDDKAAGTRA